MSRKDVLNADGENVQAIQQASFFFFFFYFCLTAGPYYSLRVFSPFFVAVLLMSRVLTRIKLSVR